MIVYNNRMMGYFGTRILIGWFLGALCFISFGQEGERNNDYQYALIEAVKQKNLGNFPEAMKLYRLVIKEKPDCDVAYYELGSLLLVTNQIESAIDNLSKAYTFDPDNQWYTLAYINALGAKEDYDSLLKILKEKHKNDPEEVEWEYQLATVYFSKGKAKKAIRTLNNIEKERGLSEKITLLKASIYENEGDFKLAREEIEKVMNLFPEAVQFRIAAAELALKDGNEDAAANYYLEILEVDSTNIFALTNLTDYYRKKEDYATSFRYLTSSFNNRQIDVKRKMAIMSYYLSDEEFIRNYPDQLDKLVQVFVNMHPEEPEGRLLAADFYISVRTYNKAFEQLKSYLVKNQGNYQLYMQAILLANASSLNKELIAMSNRALKIYPDSIDIRFFRGIGYYEEGEYENLVANYEGVNLNSFSVREYASQSKMLYAEAFYRLDNYSKSDSLFEELIEAEPDNYMVLNNYSYYLAERGEKLIQAEEWSRETIEKNPDNATFLDTYAWILYKLKEYESAEGYILSALQKGGENDPEVNEHAGDIQAALKSYEIAKSYYLKAIILGGEKEKLEEKIERLNRVEHE
jgi:tetratricopeptide (TPR) repeat protein